MMEVIEIVTQYSVLIWVPVQGTPYYVLTGHRNCSFIYSREAKGHAARKAVEVAVLAAVHSSWG